MRIGLLDVDSHNFPNLPIMKLSAYHKSLGDDVEMWNPDADEYDIVYASKVFTFSVMPEVRNAKKLVCGGSGFDLQNKLPDIVEHQYPDYGLYPQYDFAVGFLTRGCPRRNHTFCITPEKDGCRSVKVADLSEFWRGQEHIILLDQNILACRDRIDLLTQLADSKASVEFNGGLDARFFSPDILSLIKRIKRGGHKSHLAWDDPRENMFPKLKLWADMEMTPKKTDILLCFGELLVNARAGFGTHLCHQKPRYDAICDDLR